MNNVTLGNDRFTYYETIGGGQGACPDADGPSGRPRRDVEHAQHAGRRRSSSPIRCASSATRCGSARAAPARSRGGDGVVRELRVLEPCRAVGPRASAARTRRRARAAASPERPAATCSTARQLPAKVTRRPRPRATSSGSRRRAAAATAPDGFGATGPSLPGAPCGCAAVRSLTAVQLDVVRVVRGLALGDAAPTIAILVGGRIVLVPAVCLDVLVLAALRRPRSSQSSRRSQCCCSQDGPGAADLPRHAFRPQAPVRS